MLQELFDLQDTFRLSPCPSLLVALTLPSAPVALRDGDGMLGVERMGGVDWMDLGGEE